MCGTTASTTNAPNPAAASNYAAVTSRAANVANTPYQPYGGELVAGLNGGQNQAIGQLQTAYGTATPYFNAASGYLDNANQGLGGVQNYLQAGSQSVGNAQGYAGQAAGLANPNANAAYMNPYQSAVVNSTMAQAQQQDAIQRQGLASNAIGQGAYGGDRAGVAQAALAGQQDLANNQTLANLNAQNYQQANAARQGDAGIYGNLANSANQSAGTYNQMGQTQAQTGAAQGQLAGMSGYIGSAAQGSQISGASAGLQASTLQQQNAQQQDQAAYGQFQNQISYPFQTTNWLSNIDQGIGSQQGGTQTQQGSTASAVAGAATTGLGILGATGGFNSTNPVTGATTPGYVNNFLSSLARGGRVSRALGGGLAGGRMHYMDGGDAGLVDPNAPVGVQPPQGINYGPGGLMGGGGFNPTAPATAFAPSGGQQRTSSGSVPAVRMPVLGADPAADTPPPSAGLAGASGAGSSGGGLSGGAPGSQGVVGGPEMNKWLAVTAAGLGMMGGTSASGAVNIGKGGLAGLQEYTNLQNIDRQNAFQQAELGLKRGTLGVDQQRVQQESQRLQQQADQFKQTNDIAQKGLENTTLTAQSEAATRRAGLITQTYTPAGPNGQPGFVFNDRSGPEPKVYFRSLDEMLPQGGGAAGGSPAGASPGSPTAPLPASAPSTPQPDPSAPPPGVPQQAAAQPSQPPLGGATGGWGPDDKAQPQQPQQPPQAQPKPAFAGIPVYQGDTRLPSNYVPPNQGSHTFQPEEAKHQSDLGAEQIKGYRAAADSAQAAEMRLGEMDRNMDSLPKKGNYLIPGADADARLATANGVNTFAGVLGLPPIFDKNYTGDMMQMQKDTFKLGAELSKQIGGKEPGFIVQAAVKANPGMNNSYQGYKQISAGLHAANQYAMDKAQFMNNYYAKYNHLDGAQDAWTTYHPWQDYAKTAAAAQYDPRDVAAIKANAKNPQALYAFNKEYGQGSAQDVIQDFPSLTVKPRKK